MTDILKRRWFQFHLSTAVLMMFVAGVSLWLNLSPRKLLRFIDNWDTSGYFIEEWGWPVITLDGFKEWHVYALALNLGFLLILLWTVSETCEQYYQSKRDTYERESTNWIRAAIVSSLVGILLWSNLHHVLLNFDEHGDCWHSEGWPVTYRYVGEALNNHQFLSQYFIGGLLSDIFFSVMTMLCADQVLRRLFNSVGKGDIAKWRVHKGTQAVMSAVAISFSLLNAAASQERVSLLDVKDSSECHRFHRKLIGWPVRYSVEGVHSVSLKFDEAEFPISIQYVTPESDWLFNVDKHRAQEILRELFRSTAAHALLLNALTALAVMAGCGGAIEYITHRREARRQ